MSAKGFKCGVSGIRWIGLWLFSISYLLSSNSPAQTILEADGLAAFGANAPAGGGGGGSPCSTVIVALGPVRYWAFDEGTGTTTADSSGNSATGTLVGTPTWVTPGKAGAHALYFPARSKYVTSSATVATTQQTLAAWINADDLTGQSGFNIVISGTGGQNYLEVDANKNVVFKSAAGAVFIDSNTILTTGAWYHIAATIDAPNASTGTVKIYINGVLDFTSPATATGATVTQAYDVGTYAGSVGSFGFVGKVDEAVVFNRALTGTEISSIATCP